MTYPETYHTQTAKRGDKNYIMSRSDLMKFAHCPRRWRNGHNGKRSKEMEYGSLLDCLVLQPALFASQYVIAPAEYPCKPTKKDPRTSKPWNKNATYCKEWADEQTCEVVTRDDYHEALQAKQVLNDDAMLSDYLAHSDVSVMLVAQYVSRTVPNLRIPFKILIDLVPIATSSAFRQSLGDFKTCESAHPEAWVNSVRDYNYDVQAAVYLDVYNAATGEERTDFCHLVQESYAPFEAVPRMLSSEYIELGRMKYLEALELYAQCITTNTWPTYKAARVLNGWQITEPKPWMINP